VMLDLETLGAVPRCAILSIGALAFDGDQPVPLNQEPIFHAHIDVRSSQRAGLMIDGQTFMWWLKQSDAARNALLQAETQDLHTVLARFSDWVRWSQVARIWAKGPSFDCAILAAAYRAAGMEVPWDYRRERCVRTVLELGGVDGRDAVWGVENRISHDALSDAMAQAAAVQEALRRIRGERTALPESSSPPFPP